MAFDGFVWSVLGSILEAKMDPCWSLFEWIFFKNTCNFTFPYVRLLLKQIARLVSVRAFPDLDRNSYEVSVEFYVVNTPTELVDMSLMLERLR